MKDNNEDENIKIPKIVLRSALAGLTATILLNWNTIVDKFGFTSKEQVSEEIEENIDMLPDDIRDNITDENIEMVENIGFTIFDLNETAKKEFGDMDEFRKVLGIPDTLAEENISPEAYATALQWQKKYWFFTTKDDSNIQAIQCNMFGYKPDKKEEQTMVQIPPKKLFAGREIITEDGDYYLTKYDFRNDKYALISKNDVDLNIANTYKTKKDVKLNTSSFGKQTLKQGTEIKLIGNEAIYWIDGQEYQVEAKEIKDQINEKNSDALNKQPIYIYAKGISEYYKKGDPKNRMLGSEVQYDINTNTQYVTTYSLNGFGINIETKDLIETSSSMAIQEELNEAIGYQGGNYYTNNNNNNNNVSRFTPSQMEKNARHNFTEGAKAHEGETNDDERFSKKFGISSSLKGKNCGSFIMSVAYDNGVPAYVIPQGAQYADCAVMYKWFDADERKLIVENDGSYIPQEGDIVFFDSDGDPKWIDHVGIVTDSKDGMFSTVEGNTGTDGKVRIYNLKYKIGDNIIDNSGKMKPLWIAKVPWNLMVPEQETSQTQTTIKGEITADDFKDIDGIVLDQGQRETAAEICNSCMKKEIGDIYISAFIANALAESGLHSDSIRDVPNDHSAGLFQWHGGREDKLYEYVKEYNKEHGTSHDWKNIEVQINYLLYGDDDCFIEAGKRTTQSFLETHFNTPYDASMWFQKKWERPREDCISEKRGEDALKFHKAISRATKKRNDWANLLRQVNELLCKAEDKEINEEKERYYGQIIEENKKRISFRNEGR